MNFLFLLIRGWKIPCCMFLTVWMMGGCASPSSPASSSVLPTTRYEILVPVVDEDGHSRVLFQREAILRSIIADFGGVIVDQHDINGYRRDERGELKKDIYWRIFVDVLTEEHQRKMDALYSKIVEVYGAVDAKMVRYRIEKLAP